MSIIRVIKKHQPYTMILNDSIRDETLSWKAKGILCYLLSLPDDWRIYITELVSHAPDGETALRSGLSELEQQGYLTKVQVRDEAGKIAGYEYNVTEIPAISQKTIFGKTISGKPKSGKPKSGKPSTTNNDNTNNESTNNDLTNKDNTHLEMVKAISEVTGLDLKIKTNAGRVYKASKELREAGYTPEDVMSFGGNWLKDWRYKADKKPPTLNTLIAEISRKDNIENLREHARRNFKYLGG